MLCPTCKSSTKVLDSREGNAGGLQARLRLCAKGHEIKTVETVEVSKPTTWDSLAKLDRHPARYSGRSLSKQNF